MDELDDASGRNRPGSFYRTCCGVSRATVGGASQFEQVWLSSGSGHILSATFGVLCAVFYLAQKRFHVRGRGQMCVTALMTG
jgi:hypothetical protein